MADARVVIHPRRGDLSPPSMSRPWRKSIARPRRSDAVALSSGLFLLALVLLSLVNRYPRNSPSFSGIALVRQAAEERGVCDQNPGENNFLKSPAALSLYIPGILVTFVGLAVVTDEYFVPALERICEQLDLSADVAGATFMAAGSSAPELFTSLLATFVTEDDIGVGTIVGSAVFNILVIIGLSAIVAKTALTLDWKPLIRDSLFYVMSILFLMIFVLGSTRGQLDWWEGLILMLGYVSYIAFMKWGNKWYMTRFNPFGKEDPAKDDLESGNQTSSKIDFESGRGDVDSSKSSSNRGESESLNSSPRRDDLESGTSSSNRGDLESGVSSSDQHDVNSIISSPEKKASLPARTEDSTPQGQLPRSSSRRSQSTTSQSRNIYRDINPRSRFRAASRAVIAANRLSSSLSGDLADSQMVNGHLEQSVNEGGDALEKAEEIHRDGKHKIWSKLASLPGKILFPVTFIWKTLFRFTIVNCGDDKRKKWWPLTFAASIVWIGAISYGMVEAARYAGCLLSIPPAVMGLTALAAGTSVPDALASMAVARNGEGDMAVSNAIGSNVFDILLGIGLPVFLGGLIKREAQHITVEPLAEIVIPIVILFAIVVLLIGAISILRWQLRRELGYVLFGTYALFIIYSLLGTYVFFRDTTSA